MLTNRLNIDKGFQIVDWHSTNLRDYYVTVLYADGTHTSAWVDAETWNRVKEAELRYNTEEANANRHEPTVVETGTVRNIPKLPAKIENLEDVKQFLAHCREWVGACFNLDMRFADYIKINSDDDEQAIDDVIANGYDDLMGKAFAVCKKFGIDIYEMALDCETTGVKETQRETFIASCCELDAVHLCAWCRSYFITGYDGEEHTLIRLKDGEFEVTRKTGESHGICKQCKDGQIAACRDMKAEEEINVLKSKVSIVAEQRDSALTEFGVANDKITALQNEVESLEENTEEIERERDAARDLLTDMDDQLTIANAAIKQIKGVISRREDERDNACFELGKAKSVITRMEIGRNVMRLELDEARAGLEDAEGK